MTTIVLSAGGLCCELKKKMSIGLRLDSNHNKISVRELRHNINTILSWSNDIAKPDVDLLGDQLHVPIKQRKPVSCSGTNDCELQLRIGLQFGRWQQRRSEI